MILAADTRRVADLNQHQQVANGNIDWTAKRVGKVKLQDTRRCYSRRQELAPGITQTLTLHTLNPKTHARQPKRDYQRSADQETAGSTRRWEHRLDHEKGDTGAGHGVIVAPVVVDKNSLQATQH